MSLLIAILVLWILWKFFKFSLWLLGFLILFTLAAIFIKVLLIPAILLILASVGFGMANFFR
ncbi:hypothetical protein [Limosilactobacillus secaliphilus]|uniref:Uncharacterized protein n=1 Tax=Limosilactobacillus secaliphilus TaxID=396268 RepID=A0A0R2I103_9LACO|nr:hypothetical protein [Limosilactobacillus secaliphilus]KRN58801.1 hypothetical protein IV45_GL000428 [Limosilactobacillus secaliphilus]